MVGLTCPRCDTQLHKTVDGPLGGTIACKACRIDFPDIGDAVSELPFLWPEPGASLLDWRNRFNAALADLEGQISAATAPSSAPASSQQRIKLLRTALETHQRELSGLLKPLKVGAGLAKETHLALRTRLPSHHGILSYAQNIHRDWCWGQSENAQVVAHLFDALRQTETDKPRTMLVLGSGAGRLAYDLHRALTPESTWALDSNPLLATIAQRMARGDSVAFTEFPIAPLSLADTAVARTLEAPEACQGLHFVCADALRLPFAPEQFDLIVTPWLVDVLDASVVDLIQVVAHALRRGGSWLNHGSMAFQGGLPINRLGAAEFSEITAANGFNVEYAQDIMLPYLQSPASRQQRSEVTYTQVATRNDEHLATTTRHQHLPDWIVIGKAPIPLTPSFQTQITTTRIHAFIMSLIDGNRSILEMAQILEEQRLMPAMEATQAIRAFLTTMYEEQAQSQGHRSV